VPHGIAGWFGKFFPSRLLQCDVRFWNGDHLNTLLRIRSHLMISLARIVLQPVAYLGSRHTARPSTPAAAGYTSSSQKKNKRVPHGTAGWFVRFFLFTVMSDFKTSITVGVSRTSVSVL